MKLKLACADFSFPILPHEQVLRLISMLDIKGVDIGLFEDRSHLQPSQEFANVRRRSGKLRKQLEENGLTPADFFLQLALDYASRAINQPNARRRQEARNAFLNAIPSLLVRDLPNNDSIAIFFKLLNFFIHFIS